MDFLKGMKRKQLQALCKKHGIPANLSNSRMALLLSSALKATKEALPEGGEGESKDVANNRLKKVRFSPEVEMREYDPSVCGQRGRRNTRRSVVSKKVNGNQSEGVGESSGNVSTDPPSRTQRSIEPKQQVEREGEVGGKAVVAVGNKRGRRLKVDSEIIPSEPGRVRQLSEPVTGEEEGEKHLKMGECEGGGANALDSFKGMKRKQLQTLCKKHGIPANLSNSRMAFLLSSTLEATEKPVSLGHGVGGYEVDIKDAPNQLKKVDEDEFKEAPNKLKKVRLSHGEETGPSVSRHRVRTRSVALNKSSEAKRNEDEEEGKSCMNVSDNHPRTRRSRKLNEVQRADFGGKAVLVGNKRGRGLKMDGAIPAVESSKPENCAIFTEKHVEKREDLEQSRQCVVGMATVFGDKVAGDASGIEKEVGAIEVIQSRVEKSFLSCTGRGSRRTSVVPLKGTLENDGLEMKKETKRSSREADLGIVVEPEASENEKCRGVIRKASIPVENLRRSKRYSVMVSSIAADELGGSEAVGQKLVPGKRKEMMGKISEPKLTRRSTRNSSKHALVGPSVPSKVVENEEHSIPELPTICEDKFTDEAPIEFNGKVTPQATRDKEDFSLDYIEEVLEMPNDSSGTNAITSEARRTMFADISAVCSDMEEDISNRCNLEETRARAPLKLLGASTAKEKAEIAREADAEVATGDENVLFPFDDDRAAQVVEERENDITDGKSNSKAGIPHQDSSQIAETVDLLSPRSVCTPDKAADEHQEGWYSSCFDNSDEEKRMANIDSTRKDVEDLQEEQQTDAKSSLELQDEVNKITGESAYSDVSYKQIIENFVAQKVQTFLCSSEEVPKPSAPGRLELLSSLICQISEKDAETNSSSDKCKDGGQDVELCGAEIGSGIMDWVVDKCEDGEQDVELCGTEIESGVAAGMEDDDQSYGPLEIGGHTFTKNSTETEPPEYLSNSFHADEELGIEKPSSAGVILQENSEVNQCTHKLLDEEGICLIAREDKVDEKASIIPCSLPEESGRNHPGKDQPEDRIEERVDLMPHECESFISRIGEFVDDEHENIMTETYSTCDKQQSSPKESQDEKEDNTPLSKGTYDVVLYQENFGDNISVKTVGVTGSVHHSFGKTLSFEASLAKTSETLPSGKLQDDKEMAVEVNSTVEAFTDRAGIGETDEAKTNNMTKEKMGLEEAPNGERSQQNISPWLCKAFSDDGDWFPKHNFAGLSVFTEAAYGDCKASCEALPGVLDTVVGSELKSDKVDNFDMKLDSTSTNCKDFNIVSIPKASPNDVWETDVEGSLPCDNDGFTTYDTSSYMKVKADETGAVNTGGNICFMNHPKRPERASLSPKTLQTSRKNAKNFFSGGKNFSHLSFGKCGSGSSSHSLSKLDDCLSHGNNEPQDCCEDVGDNVGEKGTSDEKGSKLAEASETLEGWRVTKLAEEGEAQKGSKDQSEAIDGIILENEVTNPQEILSIQFSQERYTAKEVGDVYSSYGCKLESHNAEEFNIVSIPKATPNGDIGSSLPGDNVDVTTYDASSCMKVKADEASAVNTDRNMCVMKHTKGSERVSLSPKTLQCSSKKAKQSFSGGNNSSHLSFGKCGSGSSSHSVSNLDDCLSHVPESRHGNFGAESPPFTEWEVNLIQGNGFQDGQSGCRVLEDNLIVNNSGHGMGAKQDVAACGNLDGRVYANKLTDDSVCDVGRMYSGFNCTSSIYQGFIHQTNDKDQMEEKPEYFVSTPERMSMDTDKVDASGCHTARSTRVDLNEEDIYEPAWSREVGLGETSLQHGNTEPQECCKDVSDNSGEEETSDEKESNLAGASEILEGCRVTRMAEKGEAQKGNKDQSEAIYGIVLVNEVANPQENPSIQFSQERDTAKEAGGFYSSSHGCELESPIMEAGTSSCLQVVEDDAFFLDSEETNFAKLNAISPFKSDIAVNRSAGSAACAHQSQSKALDPNLFSAEDGDVIISEQNPTQITSEQNEDVGHQMEMELAELDHLDHDGADELNFEKIESTAIRQEKEVVITAADMQGFANCANHVNESFRDGGFHISPEKLVATQVAGPTASFDAASFKEQSVEDDKQDIGRYLNTKNLGETFDLSAVVSALSGDHFLVSTNSASGSCYSSDTIAEEKHRTRRMFFSPKTTLQAKRKRSDSLYAKQWKSAATLGRHTEESARGNLNEEDICEPAWSQEMGLGETSIRHGNDEPQECCKDVSDNSGEEETYSDEKEGDLAGASEILEGCRVTKMAEKGEAQKGSKDQNEAIDGIVIENEVTNPQENPSIQFSQERDTAKEAGGSYSSYGCKFESHLTEAGTSSCLNVIEDDAFFLDSKEMNFAKVNMISPFKCEIAGHHSAGSAARAHQNQDGNVFISEQNPTEITSEQNEGVGHHMEMELAELGHLDRAVADEPNFEKIEGIEKIQDKEVVTVVDMQGFANGASADESVKVDRFHISPKKLVVTEVAGTTASFDAASFKEQAVEDDKQDTVTYLNTKDLGATVELSALSEDHFPVFTNSGSGSDISAEDERRSGPMSLSPKTTLQPKRKGSDSLYAKQWKSAAIKVKNHSSDLNNPKALHASDMKENIPNIKEPIGGMTAPKASWKRRPLEDINY
ncbi:hypothetical protein Tsubulata_008494 [Turnera subulata]|uniref:Uncharacterized protein n=1 Tax=Turnera subulata TaxID=218843 RepID=A0A9Q0G2Y3_9ROSI|nr:hypothetical protein Tsubulata_008494 [Turnera subulata]